MNKKRILFFTPSFTSGGCEAFMVNTIEHLDTNKYLVDLVCSTSKVGIYDDRLKRLGIEKVVLLTCPSSNYIKRYLSAYWMFLKFLRERKNRYDVIHFNLAQGEDLPFVWFAKINGVKVRIVHSHNSSVNSKVKYVGHILCKFIFKKVATNYLACSEVAARWLFPPQIVHSGNYEIINNGIDTRKYAFSEKLRFLVRDKYKLENKTVFLNIGRLDTQKNQTFLLDVFDQLVKNISNAVLLVAGEGQLREELVGKTNRLGLQDKVVWLGNRKDIPEIMSASDFFLLPSIFEGLPFTLVEAQASGLPCIISDVISDQSILTDLVVKAPLNVQQYTYAILEDIGRIGTNSTVVREKYAQYVADKGFDIENTVGKMERFYQEG